MGRTIGRGKKFNYITDYVLGTQRLMQGDQHGRAGQELANRKWTLAGIDNPIMSPVPGITAGSYSVPGVDGDSVWNTLSIPEKLLYPAYSVIKDYQGDDEEYGFIIADWDTLEPIKYYSEDDVDVMPEIEYSKIGYLYKDTDNQYETGSSTGDYGGHHDTECVEALSTGEYISTAITPLKFYECDIGDIETHELIEPKQEIEYICDETESYIVYLESIAEECGQHPCCGACNSLHQTIQQGSTYNINNRLWATPNVYIESKSGHMFAFYILFNIEYGTDLYYAYCICLDPNEFGYSYGTGTVGYHYYGYSYVNKGDEQGYVRDDDFYEYIQQVIYTYIRCSTSADAENLSTDTGSSYYYDAHIFYTRDVETYEMKADKDKEVVLYTGMPGYYSEGVPMPGEKVKYGLYTGERRKIVSEIVFDLVPYNDPDAPQTHWFHEDTQTNVITSSTTIGDTYYDSFYFCLVRPK